MTMDGGILQSVLLLICKEGGMFWIEQLSIGAVDEAVK
jgi:hypothetical protein